LGWLSIEIINLLLRLAAIELLKFGNKINPTFR
jgi:hypothetical protein